MNSEPSLLEIADRLESLMEMIASLPVVAGFDAFVDEVFQIVGNRESAAVFERVKTIREFEKWVGASAGKSGLREAVLIERSAGGCAVNQGDGLTSLGFPLTSFASTGSDSVFDAFRKKCCRLENLDLEPGRTVAYEFEDGKLMLCSVGHLAQLNSDYLRKHFIQGPFRESCSSAAAIVLTGWSVFSQMNDCWRFLQSEALAGLGNRPRLFFDLADPASRSPSDLVEMLEVLRGFEAIGPVTLSLNGNEANQLAKVVGINEVDGNRLDCERQATALRERAGISEVGIHCLRFATSATESETVTVNSAYTPSPSKSVGAGDRFNAGWLAGLLLHFPQASQLLLGSACSGFFVRNARSATLPELAGFLRDWSKN
ncbi:MAG: hypothetical protein OJI67_19805 [Prosthecobacter sp.]|nr:hypothetical protein [Prosthecobacter sp.]